MKRIYSVVIFIAITFSASAKEWVGTKSASPLPANVELISSDISTTVLKATVPGFFKSPVSTGTGNAFTLSLNEAYPMLIKGAPDLLKLSCSIIIPDMAKMKVEIVSSSYTEIQNISIAPSKGNLYRNINPADVPYYYGGVYSQDAFYPGNLASLQSPYIFRDYRGQAVWFYPFQYNPVTKVLRVYSEIIVKVSEVMDKGENVFSRAKASEKIDLEFNEIYSSHFINYPQYRYAQVDETGGLLIISYGTFMSAMQPLVDWKIRRGLPTEMVSVTTVGGNSAAIKNYIVNYYNTHNLKYVLLVGDINEIPTITASGGASDPSYGYILGNDAYPEVFVGRFSAESIDDVNTQVLRTITYERTPVANAPWSNGVCVASNQGPGDDNEMDWEHERVMRLKFLAFTYTNVNELYDGTHTGGPDLPGDPTPTDLYNDMQAGVSVVNYTGHGSNTSFGTTGFSNSDIALLTNYNILPFIWSVGCVNGEFDVTTCFAEAFLRAQVSGQPTGAIGTFMASINQSWSPPMDAQDEFVDLLVGTYATNIKRTFGGLNENGCMHMNDVYGAAGVEMTDTWHCFGDPSLTVRTATPTAITATHTSIIPLGSTQLSITCNTDSAFVSLVLSGQILGTGTVAAGNVVINFPSVIVMDTIFVTITGFNKIPYEGLVLINSTVGIVGINSSSPKLNIYPNPSSGISAIVFQLNQTSDVSLNIYNALGQEVSALINDSRLNEGMHSVNLDSRSLGKGFYFIRLTAGENVMINKFVVD
ncbi:MAG TPA: C25 family cysteine peptidase [Bacteroidia bacterium]|nr:C25 family cysteine peptidase [Bacteroidia bacterium]